MTDQERLIFTLMDSLLMVRQSALQVLRNIALNPLAMALTPQMNELEWLIEEIDKTLDKAENAHSVLRVFGTDATVQE